MKVLFTLVVSLCLLLISTPVFARGHLKNFETDYCTNCPEGTREKPDLWKHCCLLHDMYFWAGGSKGDRDISDLELRSCIGKTGAIKEAQVMYYAVRAGSFSPIKYPKHKWGNGWENRPSLQALSAEEVKAIQTELEMIRYNFIPAELKSYFIIQLSSRIKR